MSAITLKKLVDTGFMHHQRSEIDRRSVRDSLTQKGSEVRKIVGELFASHAARLMSRGVLDHQGIEDITTALRRVERYWTE